MKIIIIIASFIVGVWLYKQIRNTIRFFKAFFLIYKIRTKYGLSIQQSAEMAKKEMLQVFEAKQKKNMEAILKNRLEAEAKCAEVDKETLRKLNNV